MGTPVRLRAVQYSGVHFATCGGTGGLVWYLCTMTTDADRIIGLYQRHAQAWATDRGDRLIETEWLDRFMALLEPNAEILDLGCGTGRPIARYLIEHGHRMTGV